MRFGIALEHNGIKAHLSLCLPASHSRDVHAESVGKLIIQRQTLPQVYVLRVTALRVSKICRISYNFQ